VTEKEKKATAEPTLPPEVQVVANLIKASEYSGIFDSGFNLADFSQKAEWRGMIGEQYWSEQMLEALMARFRQHVASHETKPEDIDNLLGVLSSKIAVDLNRVRRCFYGILTVKGTKKTEETPMNPAEETILAALQISRATWDALPEGIKQQIHEAVAKGQLELAKGLVAGAKAVAGTITSAAKTATGR
jgi:hypothetical protein